MGTKIDVQKEEIRDYLFDVIKEVKTYPLKVLL